MAGTLLPGILVGIGVAGTADEVVLHQILRWHHFYDRSTPAAGLVTDGLFHVFATGALALGLVLLWRRGRLLRSRLLVGAILAGAGGFNVFDGTVIHKVLRFHQVREGVASEVPYDAVFLTVSGALLLAGLALLRGARRRASAAS